jgi:hypothetical protein
MQFGLAPSQSGFVLGLRAFLHATDQRGCLFASSQAFQLQAGQPTIVSVTFDRSDRCPTPVTITNMAVVVEGTVEVASRQEWGLRYTFLP